jgi:hypothetical protein
VWYRRKYILTGLKSKRTRSVHAIRQTLHNSTKLLGDVEHSIAWEQPWFQRRIIGRCSTKRVTYSNHITLPREPLNWGRRTLSLDLSWVILAVSRHHEPGVPRACVGHRLMPKAHTVTKPWYDFFDFYYVGLLQSRSGTKHTRIVQSANMHIRHMLASLAAVERSSSFLHCIFLMRPARQRVNINLRCGRGIHWRRDSATCRYPGTRMQHPSYLVWTFNNTRHFGLKLFECRNRNDSLWSGEIKDW